MKALKFYWIPWIRSQPTASTVPTNTYKTKQKKKNAEITTYMLWAGFGFLVLFFRQ